MTAPLLIRRLRVLATAPKVTADEREALIEAAKELESLRARVRDYEKGEVHIVHCNHTNGSNSHAG